MFLPCYYGHGDAKLSRTWAQLTACSSGVEGILPPPRTRHGLCPHVPATCFSPAYKQLASSQRKLVELIFYFPPQESVSDQAGGKIVYGDTLVPLPLAIRLLKPVSQ